MPDVREPPPALTCTPWHLRAGQVCHRRCKWPARARESNDKDVIPQGKGLTRWVGGASRHTWLGRHELWLFLLLLLAYTYFFPRWADPNQNSRLDTIVALVDQGTLRIDDYVDNTVDYAKFEGHYYSDKAPGTALLGIPVYAVLKPIFDLPPISRLLDRAAASDAFAATLREEGTGLLEHKIRFAVTQFVVTWIVVSLPAALLGVLLYRFLGHFTRREAYRLGVTLIYGLASIAFPYAGAFYGHQLAAFFLFAAFYLLFAPSQPTNPTNGRANRPTTKRLLLAGFLLGWAVVTEYPTAIIAGLIFLYGLSRADSARERLRDRWVALIVGGLLPAALMAAFNLAVFHTPLPVGYRYSELWTEQHSSGFMSLGLPHSEALWGITFSPFRGLFFLSPVLLLALPGFYVLWTRRRWRAEFWLSALSVASFFIFNGSSIMWWGGFAIGPRYLVPVLPFLAWPLVLWLERWGDRLWVITLTGVLALWSFLLVWGETLGGQAFPPDTIRDTLTGYTWPHLRAGDVARNAGMILELSGWMSLLPLALLMGTLILALYRLSRPGSLESQSADAELIITQSLSYSAAARRAVYRLDLVLSVSLLLLTLLSRLPFRGQILYHWDSVNFAYALEKFDISQGQPHPPGYIGYVWLARLVNGFFGDPQATFVWLSVVGSGLAVVAVYLLGRRWLERHAVSQVERHAVSQVERHAVSQVERRVGLVAALLLASSPLFWFYGEVALPHALDGLLVILSAWMLFEVMQGQRKALIPAAVFLALAGALRQQTPIFLAPLALYAGYLGLIKPLGWKKGIIAALPAIVLFGLLCAAWFFPLINSVGGLARYRQVVGAYTNEFNATTSIFMQGGRFGLTRNLRKLGTYTLYGWGAALLPFALYAGGWLLKPQWRMDRRRLGFLLAWTTPSLAFYTLIHMGQQGLVFVFLPALLLISAEATVHILRGQRPQVLVAVVALLVAVNGSVFLFLPEYPLTSDRVKLLTRDTIENRDAYFQSRLDALQARFAPEHTVIVADSWRHVTFYLPQYAWLPYDVVSKWESGEGQAKDRQPQQISPEQLGLASGSGPVYVVLFDPSLYPFNRSPERTLTFPLPGDDLRYFSLTAGEFLSTGPEEIRVVEKP
jgi:hypothetical protein